MPVYTVEIDGHQYDLDGDHAPSEAEARAAIAVQAPKQATPPPAAATRGMTAPSTMQEPPKPAAGEMSEEAWAALPTGEKVRQALQWGGKVIAGMTGMGSAGADAVATPKTTLAMAVLPELAGKGVQGLGKGLYKGGVALLPKGLKQEFPDLASTGFKEGIALTRRGAVKAGATAKASADSADALIAAKAAERPAVAGLLPEGRTPVPLGEAPVPTGGTPSLQAAHQVQPRKVGPVGNAEEILTRQWNPVYGGEVANQAAGDVVGGAGTVLRPMNAPAVAGKVPGMISLEEALTHVPGMSRDISTGALGANEPGLQQVRKLVGLTARGRQWPAALPEAQALKRSEQELAHNAYRAADKGLVTRVPTRARYAKAVAQGTREAIESEVPAVAPVNARTQAMMGLQRAAEHSAETGHILSRLGAGATGALLGSGGGALPAVLGAVAGSTLSTPGGLTGAGLLAKKAGQVTPQMVRAAWIALMASHEQPGSKP